MLPCFADTISGSHCWVFRNNCRHLIYVRRVLKEQLFLYDIFLLSGSYFYIHFWCCHRNWKMYSFNVLVVYSVSMIVNVNTLKYIFSVHVMYYIFWHMSVFLYKFACIHIYIHNIFQIMYFMMKNLKIFNCKMWKSFIVLTFPILFKTKQTYTDWLLWQSLKNT